MALSRGSDMKPRAIRTAEIRGTLIECRLVNGTHADIISGIAWPE
jgi:hypothetical protein